jgi:hypothetical protein
METEGWNYLSIKTNSSFSDEAQAYAAGYLEGTITTTEIYYNIINTHANFTWSPKLAQYLHNNSIYMHENIANAPSDPYWHQVSLVLQQQQGVFDGYSDAAPADKQFPFTTIQTINLSGDLDDLGEALGLPCRSADLSHPVCIK